MTPTKDTPLKVYRAAAAIAVSLIFGFVMLIVGASGLAPSNHAGVGGVVFFFVVLIGAGSLIALVVTNRVEVTSSSITLWRNFRHQTIPWSNIRSFETGKSRSTGQWPCLVIVTDSGRIRVDSVAGSRAHIGRVLEELRAWQAEYTPAQVTGEPTQGG
jgi:cytochrome c biogenesis protein CcdA